MVRLSACTAFSSLFSGKIGVFPIWNRWIFLFGKNPAREIAQRNFLLIFDFQLSIFDFFRAQSHKYTIHSLAGQSGQEMASRI
jgi:hypothetical protein